MGISLMPRLLGPHQCEEQTRWDVTQHDCDDPALMGHIVAKQMASGHTFIEFWLGGFPGLSMFDEMQRALEDEIVLILLSRVRKDRPEPSAPGREDVGDREVAEEPGEGKMTTSASEHEERESRFTLNTTADHFANLLEHHTQSVHLRFLAMEGQTTLQAARRGRRGGLFTIEMEGVLCTIEGGVKAIQRIGPAISFEVIPLSDERIDVIAKCVQPAPAVESYFDELMKKIERWYPEVREQREAEIARLRARADRLLQEIDQEPQGEVERVFVPLERWDVFRHLRALCNNDARFSILQAKTDEDLERLTITDTQATKSLGTARGAVMGTVRLLPAGGGTVIMFVAKDASFHLEITDGGKVLFCEFQQRVEEHFDDLRSPTPTSDRTPHLLTFEEMGYRDPLIEMQTGHTKPAETTSQATVSKSSEDDNDLDSLDRAIIKFVRQIEEEGLKATDERVAARSPLNPQTDESYHRVTINKRRCKLRDKGFEV